MKYLLLLSLSLSFLEANIKELNSFQANFIQSITDDKKKVLNYKGDVVATKPQNARWNYTSPISKQVYINAHVVTIVEPELEQVIIKNINSNFDFFHLVKNAKQISKNSYEAFYKETKFLIQTDSNDIISSISYKDEFENDVVIHFTNQEINKPIESKIFVPTIPIDYDVIRD
jgi:outer membrane lipoprotein carrier protein